MKRESILRQLIDLGFKRVWGRCPQPGAEPLHPVSKSKVYALAKYMILFLFISCTQLWN
jgi:hypothetical protein